ncbi:MAG: class I SAM-dependent methyltransferase [Candidatus Nitrosocosmicus sp.]
MHRDSTKPFHSHGKIIVEIGSGDGRLLNNLSSLYHMDDNVLLIGIEKDESQYHNSCAQIKRDNVRFINDEFENVFANFSDETVDTVISVLPHPDYIDRTHQRKWAPLYRAILDKMRPCGHFILLTELTDELLEPVSISDYKSWKRWVIETFGLIGFDVAKVIDGAPLYFSSHYLDKFKDDPQRIRIITLILAKKRVTTAEMPHQHQ